MARIGFERLAQRYPGSPAYALRPMDMVWEDAGAYALLGPSGCGKTTLLNIVSGLLRPTEGRVVFDGQDVTALPTERRNVAQVFQFPVVYDTMTVRENLETGFAVLPRAQRRVDDEIFELFPVLRSMLRRRGGDLSGGQQQQLAIARALVMRPRLLVLDEPTEGIQPSIIKDIGRVIALLRSRGGMAILLVEQYYDFARELADTLAVMDRGDIVLSGAPGTLDEAEVRRRLSV